MLIKEVSNKLQNRNLKISFAESCTGGALVSALVSIPGASNILEESYVTYSEHAKIKLLNVKKDTIDKYSVYSKEVAYEMCMGLFNISNSDICVSITGHAGGTECQDNGIAFVCIKYLDEYYQCKLTESGSREEVRNKFVEKVFSKINELL